MKTKDKNEVIAVLAASYNSKKDRYKALVKSFLDLPTATPAQKRYYNASTFSDLNLKGIEYDICKLCHISKGEITRAAKAITQEVKQIEVVLDLPQDVIDILKTINLEEANYNKQLKQLAKQISEYNSKEPASQKKVDLIAYIESFIPKGPSLEDLKAEFTKALNAAPEDVKKGLKIREMYPFLNDDDCPDEYHTLTGKMVSAYINWKEGRKELKALLAAGATNEDIFEVSNKTVENFELNLEIHDELDYYKAHKEILGKHPIFADKMLRESVEKMSTVELTKRQKNLRTYVSRDEKAFNKMEDGEAKDKFGEKLQAWKDELELVDARLEKIS